MRLAIPSLAACALSACGAEPNRGSPTAPPVRAHTLIETKTPQLRSAASMPGLALTPAPTLALTPAPTLSPTPTPTPAPIPGVNAAAARAVTRAATPNAPWRFVVLSDIHVYSNARIPPDAAAVAKQVAKMKPRLVVITGDSTNGNKGDRFSERSVARWWKSVHAILQPIYDAKIPVLSVAGNHDSYRQRHRDGYAKAWADQAARAAPFELRFGKTPFYYSVDVGNTHLVLLDIVTQNIDKKQQAWLERDLAASTSKLKLVFGHVPIQSSITRSVRGFRNKMVPLLHKHGVTAYIAGHEHLIWDDTLKVGEATIRQVTCGTSSGTYNYGIRPSLVKRHCTKGLCQWPLNGHRFRIRKKSREMYRRTTAVAVDVIPSRGEIRVRPYYLAKDGTLTAFPRAAATTPATQ